MWLTIYLITGLVVFLLWFAFHNETNKYSKELWKVRRTVLILWIIGYIWVYPIDIITAAYKWLYKEIPFQKL